MPHDKAECRDWFEYVTSALPAGTKTKCKSNCQLKQRNCHPSRNPKPLLLRPEVACFLLH